MVKDFTEQFDELDEFNMSCDSNRDTIDMKCSNVVMKKRCRVGVMLKLSKWKKMIRELHALNAMPKS